jgi:hypothetical protein
MVCGETVEAHEKAVIRGNPSGFYGVLPCLLRRTQQLESAVHQRCSTTLSKAIFRRNFALLMLATAAIALGIRLGTSIWQVIGLVVAVTAVPILWHTVRPLPFEFTYQRKK